MRLFASFVILASLVASTHADERLEGIACRSVHLSYPAEQGAAFYNELTETDQDLVIETFLAAVEG